MTENEFITRLKEIDAFAERYYDDTFRSAAVADALDRACLQVINSYMQDSSDGIPRSLLAHLQNSLRYSSHVSYQTAQSHLEELIELYNKKIDKKINDCSFVHLPPECTIQTEFAFPITSDIASIYYYNCRSAEYVAASLLSGGTPTEERTREMFFVLFWDLANKVKAHEEAVKKHLYSNDECVQYFKMICTSPSNQRYLRELFVASQEYLEKVCHIDELQDYISMKENLQQTLLALSEEEKQKVIGFYLGNQYIPIK